MTDGVSDDDDNSEIKSVDSMANRKRKLNTILCSNKRMYVEQAIGKVDTDIDSDSNHEANDHGTSINDNDDGTSSRMSDFDDGKCWKFYGILLHAILWLLLFALSFCDKIKRVVM